MPHGQDSQAETYIHVTQEIVEVTPSKVSWTDETRMTLGGRMYH